MQEVKQKLRGLDKVTDVMWWEAGHPGFKKSNEAFEKHLDEALSKYLDPDIKHKQKEDVYRGIYAGGGGTKLPEKGLAEDLRPGSPLAGYSYAGAYGGEGGDSSGSINFENLFHLITKGESKPPIDLYELGIEK